MLKRFFDPILILFVFSLAILVCAVFLFPNITNAFTDKDNAFSYLEEQMSFGPRTPGSEAHEKFLNWVTQKLSAQGWDVDLQKGNYKGHEITNVIASRQNLAADPDAEWIMLGAHYDSRLSADADSVSANQTQPVPGANDGASGVAILLELAERLPKESDKNIWLVFFDGEDQGNIAGWDEWCIGSKMMAQYLEKQDRRPDKVVVIDMVGDKDLQIFREKNSDKALTDEIWSTAAKEGLSNIFQDKEKYSIYDDHIPFLQIGIPAVDLIDFDYPAWHTLADDIQNVSSDSLAAVEQVLYDWLTKK